jgi:peptide/nickel transport system permease protein
VQVRLFPTSGYGGVAFFVLPVAAVMTRPVGRLVQTTRESLREELTKEYIVTGLAKGLPAITVLVRHALRNALTSVITLGGDELAALVAGAAAVEVIFAWPGTGFLSVQAIERRDTNLVLGIVLVVAAFVIVLNILIDIAYKVIDRRIELR